MSRSSRLIFGSRLKRSFRFRKNHYRTPGKLFIFREVFIFTTDARSALSFWVISVWSTVFYNRSSRSTSSSIINIMTISASTALYSELTIEILATVFSLIGNVFWSGVWFTQFVSWYKISWYVKTVLAFHTLRVSSEILIVG